MSIRLPPRAAVFICTRRAEIALDVLCLASHEPASVGCNVVNHQIARAIDRDTQLFGERTWEVALPNGQYAVHLVAGDPSYTNSIYKFNAEGVLVVSGTPNSSSRWIEGTKTVTVSDGRLTITNALGASSEA